MSIVIEKHKITRITEVEFPDGKDIVGEALEYKCSCGCVIIYGVRYKGGLNETCMMCSSCENHPKLRDNLFQAGQKGHPMYDEETDKVISWAILYGGNDG